MSADTHDIYHQMYGSIDQFQSQALEHDLVDCFLHLPILENIPFILMYANIAQAQPGDAQLQLLHTQKPNQYIQKLLAPNLSLWCYQKAQSTLAYLLAMCNAQMCCRVVSPQPQSCGSASINGYNVIDILQSITTQFVEAFVTPCAHCQCDKNVQRGHGTTAPWEADLMPSSNVAVNTICPWVLSVLNRHEQFYMLTIIDMVTNLTEIVRLLNCTSAHAATVFTNTWLAQYPKPTTSIYDQGSEFIGWPFQHMLEQYNIQHQPTIVKNPQANAKCKHMHQALGNSLHVLKQWTPPNHLDDAHLLVDTALANAMYSTHATFHSGLMTTPGAPSMVTAW
jgi:hypothetical protein